MFFSFCLFLVFAFVKNKHISISSKFEIKGNFKTKRSKKTTNILKNSNYTANSKNCQIKTSKNVKSNNNSSKRQRIRVEGGMDMKGDEGAQVSFVNLNDFVCIAFVFFYVGSIPFELCFSNFIVVVNRIDMKRKAIEFASFLVSC